ncbi:MAG: metallophosphoesterase [Litoreibacter sp.]|nr:metallophosphoesterase [Litoreibacter sp.]
MADVRCKWDDRGELTGDVLLFGGPSSNLEATEALFSLARAQGIGRANRICTGDIIAYCGDPARTYALVRAECETIVAGNCERQLGAGAEACGCGFKAGSACDLASRGWYAHAAAQSGAWAVEMLGLPDMVVFRHNGLRYAVIHGGITNISRFIWPCSEEGVFAEEIAAIEAIAGRIDAVVAGHCGISFQRNVMGRLWINVGVIGMPPHDGRPETRFVVLGAGGVLIERLSYDHEKATTRMIAQGLTQGYEETLRSGIWPNEDILPRQLRQQPAH